MKTNYIEIDETYWGKVNSVIMPVPDIYFVSSNRNEGYIISEKYSGNILSAKELSFGIEHSGCLYFPSGKSMCIIEHTLLLYRLQSCSHSREAEALQEQLNICKQHGQIDQPDYFGEYPPPRRTTAGIVEQLLKVRNGIYLAKVDTRWMLGVCLPVADGELTTFAQEFGQWEEDYLFFNFPTSAIPIFELHLLYPEVKKIIQSQQALYTVLWEKFPIYVSLYNKETCASEYQIPKPSDQNAGQAFLYE